MPKLDIFAPPLSLSHSWEDFLNQHDKKMTIYSSISKKKLQEFRFQSWCRKFLSPHKNCPRDAEWYVAPTSFFDSPSESPEKKAGEKTPLETNVTSL